MKMSDSVVFGEIYYERSEGDIALRTWLAGGGVLDASRNITTRDMEDMFPWICDVDQDVLGNLELKYRAVLHNDIDIEDIARYLIEIEPDCGKCNMFRCLCNESAHTKSIVRKSRLS